MAWAGTGPGPGPDFCCTGRIFSTGHAGAEHERHAAPTYDDMRVMVWGTLTGPASGQRRERPLKLGFLPRRLANATVPDGPGPT